MAGVLTAAHTIACPHGGSVTPLLSQRFVVDAQHAVVTYDGPVHRVQECPDGTPCTTASIDAGDSPLTEAGARVCLDTATGRAFGADGADAGPLTIEPAPSGLDGGLVVR